MPGIVQMTLQRKAWMTAPSLAEPVRTLFASPRPVMAEWRTRRFPGDGKAWHMSRG